MQSQHTPVCSHRLYTLGYSRELEFTYQDHLTYALVVITSHSFLHALNRSRLAVNGIA